MEKDNDVLAFAERYHALFMFAGIKYMHFIDRLYEDCNKIGFSSYYKDEYVSFNSNDYGDIFDYKNEFKNIHDVMLLGNAIYVFCKRNVEKASSYDEEVGAHNRRWVVNACRRMYELSACVEHYYGSLNKKLFHGTLKEAHFDSYKFCPWFRYKEGTEMRQVITFYRDGHIDIKRYGRSEKGYSSSDTPFSIETLYIEDGMERVFNSITEVFSQKSRFDFATDSGEWKAFLVNEDGEVFRYIGIASRGDVMADGADLSDLIRETLGIDYLLLFDECKAKDELI